MFIGFDKIFGDLGLTFCFCIFIVLMLALVYCIFCILFGELYCLYIKKPICKYIKKRNERLMIKIYSDLELRRNSKTQYLKLL